MRKTIFGFLIPVVGFISLTGCTATGRGGIASSYEGTDISPTGSIKLAGIYRTISPLSKTDTFPEVKEICPEDFTDTKALIAIRKKYDNPTPISKPNDTINKTVSDNIGISGLAFWRLTAGASYKPSLTTTGTYTGVHVYTADDNDLNTVKSQIGSGCQVIIQGWKEKGHGVFIVERAYKADDLNIVIKDEATTSGNVGIQIGKLKPGLDGSRTNSNTVTISGKNFFYKVKDAN